MIKFNEDENTIEWIGVERRFSTFFGSKSDSASSISIDDITEVRKGVQTDVLSKGGLLDPGCCLSIITADRTLDLVVETVSERSKVIAGLQGILSAKAVKFI